MAEVRSFGLEFDYAKATLGREAVTEGDEVQQASRDRHFQQRLAAERRPQPELSPGDLHKAGLKMLRRQSQAVMEELKSLDPSGICQVSKATAERCQAFGLELEHLGASIGTVVRGVDLSLPLADDVVDLLRTLLLERKAIFFRDQTLNIEQHQDFTKRFGSLEVHPFAAGRMPGHEEVLAIGHGPGSPGTENTWHSDVTWRAAPSLGSVLYCLENPPFGGDTLFADANAMFLGLPPKLRSSLPGKEAVHDFANFRVAQLKAGVSEGTVDDLRRAFPVAKHPVIRSHPETGRLSLYVNAAFTRYIEGISRKESDLLLQMLYREASHPEYQCRFRWAQGSVAFWDNRQCQHLATSDYYPMERRMHRVTIQGDAPFWTPSPSKL